MLARGPVGDVGLGFFVGGEGETRRFGHGGDNEGFKAQLDTYVDAQRGIAVMANGDRGHELIEEIVGAVAREEEWPVPPGERLGTFRAPPPASDTDASALAALVGTYELRPDYRLTLTEEGGRLRLEAPGQPVMTLQTVGADRFEAAALELEIVIARDDDRVAGLTIRQGGDEREAARR
jgi:hypothetical protein